MTMNNTDEEYEARGIFDDTWACFTVLPLDDAKEYLWRLAEYGVPTRISRDAKYGRWHIATPGGLKHSPAAWLAGFREEDPNNIPICPAELTGQHPQAVRMTTEGGQNQD